jgi:hypothetical protein
MEQGLLYTRVGNPIGMAAAAADDDPALASPPTIR